MRAPREIATDLIDFLDASPSPYHAAGEARRRLLDAGFSELAVGGTWPSAPGRYLVTEGGTLFAWVVEEGTPPAAPFRLIGAHTDSPTLRLKPRPDTGRVGVRQLGVEIYGGALVNSWLGRDLGLAGRVVIATPSGPEIRLLRIDRPVLVIPQLAIHLDRSVVTTGLLLDPQQHLSPIWSLGGPDLGGFNRFVATELEIRAEQVLAHDIVTYDLSGATLCGANEEFLSSARLDDLVCAHAATTALCQLQGTGECPHVSALVLFDHEEVGSRTATGAGGAWLARQLERTVLARGGDRDDFLRALLSSIHVSADMTHATHPNYPERHDPEHHIALGGGPVMKTSANALYGTDAPSQAVLLLAARQAGVELQYFVNRNDSRSGSSIGPIVAAGLGIPTVDIGNPMLAMHSARELCGSSDPALLIATLAAFLCPAQNNEGA